MQYNNGYTRHTMHAVQ